VEAEGAQAVPADTVSQHDAEYAGPAIAQTGLPPVRSLEQLENSQAAMRDTTKWLVAAAAAVGAVLVAGLQLKDVPHGTWATTVALVGIAFALVAVVFILYRASKVLVTGYTTFGQILELRVDDKLKAQKARARQWGSGLQKMTAALEPLPAGVFRRILAAIAPSRIWKGIKRTFARAALPIWDSEPTRRLFLHSARNEGYRIQELLDYLNADTFYFTQGLARDIPGLDTVLRDADEKVLGLRGEEIAGGSTVLAPGVDPLKLRKRPPARGPSSADRALLEEAEWRQDQLESAMRVLVAFANQRLLEHRFHKLVHAIVGGGIVIALGVGAFVVAPKLAKPEALTITQPTRVSISVRSGYGHGCRPGLLLQGVAVGGTWDEPVVVNDANPGCPAQEVVVNNGQAAVVPVLGSAPSATTTPSP
jgi:hypothetical protein